MQGGGGGGQGAFPSSEQCGLHGCLFVCQVSEMSLRRCCEAIHVSGKDVRWVVVVVVVVVGGGLFELVFERCIFKTQRSAVHLCLLVGKVGGHSVIVFFVCCCSDDETQAESLNLCISDELALLFISHHHILQLGTLNLSCQTLVPAAHTGMHMCSHVHTDPQTRSEAHDANDHTWTVATFTPICRGAAAVFDGVLCPLHFPSSVAPFHAVTSLWRGNRG